jgi:putative chitinase
MSALKQGSSGPEVLSLQKRLKELGFDPNGVDGSFGLGTKAALVAFQTSNGLASDGIAGPQTMAALQLDGVNSNAGPSGSDAIEASASLKLNGLGGHVPASVLAQIPGTANEFGITTNRRLAHFLAQCALESRVFTAIEENLHYSAKRLMKVFPKYFRGVDTAPFANNPAKIANRVYADRMGNGNEASGDGFKFRGRGYIQLTGKSNYSRFSQFIGEDCIANPELVASKYPLASAAYFFQSNNLWTICDKGADVATVTAVSTAVNGKNPHGVPERIRYFKEFMQALS